MRPACACHDHPGPARRIVLTGGPCAGKTAVLEVAQQLFCRHVVILPEAAGIVFAGGFPRRPTPAAREAAQRAIYYVQHELERMALEEGEATTILCDRGTIDGNGISDVMNPTLIVARADEQVDDVLARLQQQAVRRIPIVDDAGGLVGILTLDDIVTWLAERMADVAGLLARQASEE